MKVSDTKMTIDFPTIYSSYTVFGAFLFQI